MPYGNVDKAGTQSTPTAGASLRVHYVPLTIEGPRTLSKIVAFAGPGTGNFAFFLMDSSCNLLATSSTATAPGNVAFEVNISYALVRGEYYLGWTSTQTADKLLSPPMGYFGNMLNLNGTSSTFDYFYGATAATGGSPIVGPASCGTRTADPNGNLNGIPAVVLK
jgi:hypothetical protein